MPTSLSAFLDLSLKFLSIELGLWQLFHVGGALCAATVAARSAPPTNFDFLKGELGPEAGQLFHVGGALCAATVAARSAPPTNFEIP